MEQGLSIGVPLGVDSPCIMVNAHILLVDNEKDFVDINALLWKRQSYQVRCFYNGPSALAAMKDLHADAVLLGIGVPYLDGYEVCRRLRAGPC